MKEKTEKGIKVVLILIIILIIIGIISFFIYLKLGDNISNGINMYKLSKLKYDIILEENHDRSQYREVGNTGIRVPIDIGGYANYSYNTLVNSKTNEEIEVCYQNIYGFVLESESRYNISVKIRKISNQEVKEDEEEFGKSEEMLNVKDLVDKHYKDYKVKSLEYDE